MKRTTLTTLLTLIASGPHLHAQTPKEVRGAIDRGNAQYIAAFADADARALAGVYDRNGARLSSNGAVTRGQEAIAREVVAFLDRAGPVTVAIETVDLWVIDDVAYETGLWSYTFTPQGEAERTVGGRYVTIWKEQASGGWKSRWRGARSQVMRGPLGRCRRPAGRGLPAQDLPRTITLT